LRPSSRIGSSAGRNYAEAIQRVQCLSSGELEKLPNDKREKETAEAIDALLESTKNVLGGQKLAGFRECTVLMAKYSQQWKKRGEPMRESNSAVVLSAFRAISEELSRITKDERNDELARLTNLIPSVMGFLESAVGDVESMVAADKDKRGSLMRRGSLKKTNA
jgi:hypothetical protein